MSENNTTIVEMAADDVPEILQNAITTLIGLYRRHPYEKLEVESESGRKYRITVEPIE